MDDARLQITIQASDGETTLKLAGSLVQQTVEDLLHLWRRIRGARLAPGTRVDLSRVGTIDAEGWRVLAEMERDGAQVSEVEPAG